jgi:hypothetical protein
MADEIQIRDANKAPVGVLTDTVTQRNGSPAPGTVEGQVVKMAHGTDGEFKDVSPATPMPAEDFSKPLVQFAMGGFDISAGAVTPIVGANVLRKKLSVLCDQDDAARLIKLARVWVSAGADSPAVGRGGLIRPDGAFEEWIASAVSVFADAACRVTWIEWG